MINDLHIHQPLLLKNEKMFRDDVISGAESRLRQWRTSEGFISLISWRSALQHPNLQFRTASFVHVDLPFIFLTSAERLLGERGGLNRWSWQIGRRWLIEKKIHARLPPMFTTRRDGFGDGFWLWTRRFSCIGQNGPITSVPLSTCLCLLMCWFGLLVSGSNPS